MVLWEKAIKCGRSSLVIKRQHSRYTTIMEDVGALYLTSCGCIQLSTFSSGLDYGSRRMFFTRKLSAKARAKDTMKQLNWKI